MQNIWIPALIFFVFLSGCKLGDNSLEGQIGDGSSTLPSITPPNDSSPSEKSWGVNGLLNLDITQNRSMYFWNQAVQPNGGIILGQISNHEYEGPDLIRVKPDGTLDTNFGDNGSVFLPTYNGNQFGIMNIVASNTAVYIAFGGNSFSGGYVLKIKMDGTVDTSFGTQGVAVLSSSTLFYIRSFEIQNDGKILVGGTESFSLKYRVRLIRLNTDGSIDSTFASGGEYILASVATNYFLNNLHIDSDNSIWLGVSEDFSNSGDFFVIKLLSDGSDGAATGFASGSNSMVNYDTASFRSHLYGVRPLSTGKVFAFGDSSPCNGCTTHATIMRINTDGSLDTSFGGTGMVKEDYGYSVAYRDVIELPGDEYLFYGSRNSGAAIITKFKNDGTVDTTFGSSGHILDPLSMLDNATGFLVKNNELIIVGINATTINGLQYTAGCVSRFSVDGTTLQVGWADGGHSCHAVGKSDIYINAQVDLPDGKQLVIGDGQGFNSGIVARLDEEGHIDETFGVNGIISNVFGENSDYAAFGDTTADGKIIIGGMSSNHELSIAKFLSNGQRDTTFGTAGVQMYDFPTIPAHTYLAHFLVQDDGGMYALFFGWEDVYYVKILSDGSLDTSFSGDGILEAVMSPDWTSRIPMFAALQSDGKVVVSGLGTSNVPSYIAGLFFIRINTDGTLDGTFGAGGFVAYDWGSDCDETPQGLLVSPENKIYSLSTTCLAPDYDNEAHILALNNDGTLDTGFAGTGELNTGPNFYVDTNAWMRQALAYQDDTLYVFGTNNDDDLMVGAWEIDGVNKTDFGVNGFIDFAPQGLQYRSFSAFMIEEDGSFKISFTRSGYQGILKVPHNGDL